MIVEAQEQDLTWLPNKIGGTAVGLCERVLAPELYRSMERLWESLGYIAKALATRGKLFSDELGELARTRFTPSLSFYVSR